MLHTYHSNAIEGNTLSLSETKLVLETGITIGGKTLAEHIEATNNAKAFDLVGGIAREREKSVDYVMIQDVHEVVTAGILEDAGRYRTHNVRITGAAKTPPDGSKVAVSMDELVREVAENRMYPIDAAAFLHHRFVEIHPFTDGNGRVARLLSNLYLIAKGYPPVVVRTEYRERYYRFPRSADAGDLVPFTNFIAKAVDEGLALYLSVFGGDDELVPLKELAGGGGTPHSREYLSLLSRRGVLDAVKIGGCGMHQGGL